MTSALVPISAINPLPGPDDELAADAEADADANADADAEAGGLALPAADTEADADAEAGGLALPTTIVDAGGAADGLSSEADPTAANLTGVNVSFWGSTTPWAPMVMTPQVAVRQSMWRVSPSRPVTAMTGPGITSVVRQAPSAAITPPLAADRVAPSRNDTNLR